MIDILGYGVRNISIRKNKLTGDHVDLSYFADIKFDAKDKGEYDFHVELQDVFKNKTLFKTQKTNIKVEEGRVTFYLAGDVEIDKEHLSFKKSNALVDTKDDMLNSIMFYLVLIINSEEKAEWEIFIINRE